MASNAANATVLDPHDQWLENLDTSHIKPLGDDWQQHPFWSDQKELEDDSTVTAKVAKEMAVEDTPEEKAESCKNTGNDLVRQGKQRKARQLLRSAVDKYAEGLRCLHDSRSTDTTLRCALLSNQAQAQALLGNWRNSLQSAQAAIKAEGTHFKSYLRAATAAARVCDWQLVGELCQAGLALEPNSAELLSLQKKAHAEAEAARQREAAVQQELAARARPLQRVATCLSARGYRMTRPQFGFQKNQGAFLPWLEGGAEAGEDSPALGALHFPVMLFYPEAAPYHDTVEDACETDSIRGHLDAMFGRGAPAIQWDEERVYTRERVQLFYCSHCGTVLREPQIVESLQGMYPSNYVETGCQKYGPRKSQMVPVDEDLTFAELLARPDHVIPGIPVLFVVAKGTPFHARFVQSFDPRG